MINSVECQHLFALESVLIKRLFCDVKYPWDILPCLGELIEGIISEGVDGYELIADGVLASKGARISPSAHVEGPAIIGDRCELRHGAYLRGSVILADGCIVGNSSEVKNSVLMEGASAPHFNYVGDSILGRRAHLGAGAICSNLRSDEKPVKIHTEGGSIETTLRKLGAILADGAEIGCGAILCPGTVVGRCTTVYPLTLARGTYPSDSIVKSTHTVVDKI